MYKVDNERDQTLYSRLCGDLNGKEIQARECVCVCVCREREREMIYFTIQQKITQPCEKLRSNKN